MPLTNAGHEWLLNVIRGAYMGAPLPPGNLFIRLFKNNYTPDCDTELADLVEATFPGYDDEPDDHLTSHGLSLAFEISPCEWAIVSGVFTWIVDEDFAGEDVYGAYLIDDDNAKVYWADRHPTAPVHLENIGDRFYYSYRIRLAECA